MTSPDRTLDLIYLFLFLWFPPTPPFLLNHLPRNYGICFLFPVFYFLQARVVLVHMFCLALHASRISLPSALPINQSINQPINQSINQSATESINRLVSSLRLGSCWPSVWRGLTIGRGRCVAFLISHSLPYSLRLGSCWPLVWRGLTIGRGRCAALLISHSPPQNHVFILFLFTPVRLFQSLTLSPNPVLSAPAVISISLSRGFFVVTRRSGFQRCGHQLNPSRDLRGVGVRWVTQLHIRRVTSGSRSAWTLPADLSKDMSTGTNTLRVTHVRHAHVVLICFSFFSEPLRADAAERAAAPRQRAAPAQPDHWPFIIRAVP